MGAIAGMDAGVDVDVHVVIGNVSKGGAPGVGYAP
jgi:hypothetical protein